jgi:hypothetical protein
MNLMLLAFQVAPIVPAANSILYSPIVLAGFVTIALALIAGLQLIVVTRTNASVAAAAELRAAKIRAEEKAEDWRRQDVVAEKVATAAKQAADAAALLVAAQAAAEVRQDAVAARVATAAGQAAEAADLLLKAQAESIARTDEVARIAAEADTRVQAQLTALDEQGKKIHTLVNSDMTAARTAERDAMKLLLISLRQVAAANVKMELPTPAELTEQIEYASGRILELDQILADRMAAQKRVDDQTTDAAAPTPHYDPAKPGKKEGS